MKDKFLVISFLSILGFVLLFFPIKHILIVKGIDTLDLTANWKFFEPQIENNIIDKFENFFNSKKNNIENRINNYFPFYEILNSLYQNTNFYLNKLVYKNNIPLKTNHDGEYIFFNNENDFYYLVNNLSENKLNELLQNQIEFYKKINEKVDVYVYLPTRYDYTTLKQNNLNKYVQTFKKELENDIHLSIMEIDSIEQYKKYFYKTDHHWTMEGAKIGYNSIMKMFEKEPYPNLEIVTIKDKKYYGSFAKSVVNDNVYDYLQDFDLNLEYDVFVNGEINDRYKPRQMVLQDNKYYDYYVQYFNGSYGEVIYDYKQENEENLLLFADSYAWPIDYLIASSFNKTHVISLRYDYYKNGTMDILKYVEEHNIDKVLFLGESGMILFDQYNYGYARKVK